MKKPNTQYGSSVYKRYHRILKGSGQRKMALSYFIELKCFKILRHWTLTAVVFIICPSPLLTHNLKEQGKKEVRKTFSRSQEESPQLTEGDRK